jgi:hypothetical protein
MRLLTATHTQTTIPPTSSHHRRLADLLEQTRAAAAQIERTGTPEQRAALERSRMEWRERRRAVYDRLMAAPRIK